MLGLRVIEMKAAPFFEICRVDLNRAIFAGGDCRPTIESNRGGHDKTIVVIGMLADQVDSPRGAIDAAGLAVQRAKVIAQVCTAAGIECSRTCAHSRSAAALLMDSVWFWRR